MKNILLFLILGMLFYCQAQTEQASKTYNLNLSLDAGEYSENASWYVFLNKLDENGMFVKESYPVTLDDQGNATVPLALGDVNLVVLNFQDRNDKSPWQNNKQFFVTNKGEMAITCLVENRELKSNSKELDDKNNRALSSFLEGIYTIVKEPGAFSREAGVNEMYSKRFMEFTNDFIDQHASVDKTLKSYLRLVGYNYALLRNIQMAKSDLFKESFYKMYTSQLMFFEYSSPQILRRYIDEFENLDGDTLLDNLENKIEFVNVYISGSKIEEWLIDSYLQDFKRRYKFDAATFESDLERLKVIAQNLKDVAQRNEFIALFEKVGLTEKGASFPSLELETTDGKLVSSTSLFKDNKYIYIDLWASWCKPCVKEIPALKVLEKEYKDKNIEFVSISIDAKVENWHKAMKQYDLHGTQLLDKENQIGNVLNIQGIPRFLFYGPKGDLILIDAPRPTSTEIRSMLDTYL